MHRRVQHPAPGARGWGPFPAALVATLIVVLATAAPSARAGNRVWTGTSPRAKSVEAIARDPLSPSRAWAATFGAGVYRSLDGGATWTGHRTGLVNTFVRCLAVQPRHPDSLYCGTNDGLYLSVDGGVTWKRLLSTLSGGTIHSVRAVIVHPVRTGVVYAATFGLGAYKSLNGGATWSAINLGLPSTSLRTIRMNPARPETLLAGAGTGFGIQRSVNGGLSWAPVPDTTATAGSCEEIEFDALNPLRIYAAESDRGVLRSTDGGQTWASINRGLTSFRTRCLAVVDTLRYLGTDGMGVFFTTLNDTMWHPANAGLSSGVVDGLWSSAAAPATVWAATDGGGIFTSTSSGGLWTQQDGGLLSTFAFSLAVRPSSHRIYDGAGFGDQTWCSGDGAATWTRAAYLFSRDSEHGICPDPLLPSTVYLATYGTGVYRSLDDGATWSDLDSLNGTLTNGYIRPLIAWPGQGGHLFAGSAIGPFESTDGGAHWLSRVGNLPAGFGVHALALVPGSPATLFAGSDSSGVYRSTDGGATWSAKNVGLFPAFIHDLMVDATNSAVVYAATDSGVFRSANSGDLWTRVITGLPVGEVRALAQDLAHPGTLFCGVFGGGVFTSVNGGASWQTVFGNSGLANLNVRSLAVDGTALTVYAGTDNGVAAASNYPALGVEGAKTGVPALQIRARPNPCPSGPVSLSLGLPRAGPMRLEVFALQGGRVRELANAVAATGRSTVVWDGRDDHGRTVPAGVYFVRLTTRDGIGIARLVRMAR